MTVTLKYTGPIERGMIFTAPDNAGVLGLRRVRMLGRDLDDRLILEELPSRMTRRGLGAHELRRCPEINLRIVFELEEEEAIWA